MKKLFSIFFLSLFISNLSSAQELDFLSRSSFKAGEKITYKLKYGFFTAAEATIQVLPTDIKFDNKPTYHLMVDGSTSGSFDVFYKVRNRYDSYIDQKDFTPYLYTENVREDKYTRNDKARFYQDQKKVVASKGTFKSPVTQTFDLVSAYYFARNLDLTGAKIGDKFSVNYFLDDEITPLTIQYVGKETIRTSLGKIACLKFSPSIRPGRIFKRESKLYLWISDDANRIPVRAKAEVLVGSIILEINTAEGLKSTLKKL
ncbi:ATP-dependent exodnase (exonuclease V) alpha subunit - helicase superfamily I member [Pedobacter psychrophilus]|uniref:ATP-dependent exodnase (Exonuclease V) alpha subunit-helicase superfamily I member n=1 Tax=Pedobacter psychrophilus TaxID=1826909 RepID=A0A179DB09_9SPHI|nr:DUF3108 domain-containing protein [Pedobacter psychrophilus]OAQ37962.1 ATP-dependent exodnase (exonuclease V) alpha subunit - helicase superfamily I member [Pedobacter psychrophilus]